MGDTEQAIIRAVTSIHDIGRDDWDACANPDQQDFDPFVSFDFLACLEDSGCVAPETGWAPQHLALQDDAGRTLGCMPCYLKSHSYGEYVFDHGWAEAYEAAGGRYYPKLQSSVPFTPVSSRRLLVPRSEDADARESLLLSGAVKLTQHCGASSLHITFVSRGEWDRGGRLGLLQRTDQQFHWYNNDYQSFDGFLDALSSRKRKAIRKERREARSEDMRIELLTGSELRETHWDAFYAFYQDTGLRKWGSPYLNRRFFSLLGERMAERVLLILCSRDDRPIAGALNLIGGDALYGRYWGSLSEHRFLHFELCYYQAIDYAIVHGLGRVEAGAQGPHKLARGYVPTPTYSLHYIADPGLAGAVERYLERERDFVGLETEALRERAPYKKPGDQ